MLEPSAEEIRDWGNSVTEFMISYLGGNRERPQNTACVEPWQIQTVIARELCQKLATNQIPAKNKKKIYTDPTPPMHATGQRKTHDAGVINDDDDDCQRPKQIETGLPLRSWNRGSRLTCSVGVGSRVTRQRRNKNCESRCGPSASSG
jgi:hypothetical protein